MFKLTKLLVVCALMLNTFMLCGISAAAEENRITNVVAGQYHTLALDQNGMVWSWGENTDKELGRNTRKILPDTPAIVDGLKDVVAIAAPEFHSLAIVKDGTVWAWGNNQYGQLGDGTNVSRGTPVKVRFLSDVVAVSGGIGFSVALKKDGTVWAWGYNGHGSLGDGTYEDKYLPTQVKGLTDIVAISNNEESMHVLALKKDGTVWAWGNNSEGQLGDGSSKSNSNIPVQVLGLSDVVAVSAGWTFSMALKKDGTVWAWGDNSSGQLGDGTFSNHNLPVQVHGLDHIKAISSGYRYSFAVQEDGSIWAWGDSKFGQLGDGAIGDISNIPIRVQELTDVVYADGGHEHSIALKKDGSVWTWGYNSFNQLGFADDEIPEHLKNFNAIPYPTQLVWNLQYEVEAPKKNNIDSRVFAIQPKYDEVGAFSEGLARVKKGDNWGFIDKTGQEVIMFPYLIATGDFSEGLAPVYDQRGYGFVDKTGKVVITPQYDQVWGFKEGIALVKKKDDFLFIDKTGHEIADRPFPGAGQFSEGLAQVTLSIENLGDRVGFIDKTGKPAVSSIAFDYAGEFHEGLAQVQINGKWNYIDKTGEPISSVLYDNNDAFNEGLGRVKKNDKVGYIDHSGKEVIPPKFTLAYNFYEGMAIIIDNKKYGFINRTGNVVIKPKYDYAERFNEGLALVREGKLFGFIDRSGKVVANTQYEDAFNYKEGLARVMRSGKWGFIDQSGKEVIPPLQFDEVADFSEGFAPVKVNGKWGFISSPLTIPDEWAKSEVSAAESLNLIPEDMAYGYKNNITRSDFCKLVVNLLMIKGKVSSDDLLVGYGKTTGSSSFVDTADPMILYANSLGIVTGKGQGIFDPYGEITRQDAAVMLARTAKILGISNDGGNATYADDDEIASWAKDSVSLISSIKDKTNQSPVMGSTGNNNFSPKASYTKQQAIMTMKRLYNAS